MNNDMNIQVTQEDEALVDEWLRRVDESGNAAERRVAERYRQLIKDNDKAVKVLGMGA